MTKTRKRKLREYYGNTEKLQHSICIAALIEVNQREGFKFIQTKTDVISAVMKFLCFFNLLSNSESRTVGGKVT